MFVTWLAFVPGAKLISKRVITGPGKAPSTFPSMPNSSNLITRLLDKSSKYSFVISADSSIF